MRSGSAVQVKGLARVCIGLGDEAVDGGLQVDDGAEDSALEAMSAELGEEALDGVEPRAGSWREVENEPGMPLEPRPHVRVFLGGICFLAA
jgi:hypothetical protein